MTQGLWVVNSSLLVIFCIMLFVNSFLKLEPPILRLKRILVEEIQKKKQEALAATIKTWEKIYQNDIFGTFVQQEVKIVKQSFITPIPEPKATVVIPPPEIKKIDFVAPLNITVKGLIVAADENKSIAMVADEAGKEGIYHLGEKIKDAQIIKIARNRIIFIRANGQHETFYLRKDDLPGEADLKWKGIVKKINDQSYEIDPVAFKEEVDSLGNFIERTAIIGTAYTQGTPVGIHIGKLEATDVGAMLGLVENDIITSVNNMKTADAKERMKIYDASCAFTVGDIINVSLKRAGKNVTIVYKLAKLEKPRKIMGPSGKVETVKPGEELKMSRAQQREHTLREFTKQHKTQRNRETLMEVRKRLLENLHARLRNARVR
jgi:type II secretory pathway component PulC